MVLVVLIVVGAGAIVGGGACSRPRPPGAEFAATCRSDDECRTHLCLGERANEATGYCTKSCAADRECPRDYSCSAVTQAGVLVCRRGASVPFLPGGPGANR